MLARDEEALHLAPRARAAAAPQGGQVALAQLARRSSPSRARRRTATPPGTASRRAPRRRAVRSNRYCTGVPTPAANGHSQHLAVIDHVQVDDRRAAEPRQRARARVSEQRLEQRGGARVGQRHDHRLGAQPSSLPSRLAAAAAEQLEARAASAPAARARQPSRTSHPGAAPAPAPRGPADGLARGCARESRCRPRRRVSSRPVWNTNAPSASDACAAGRLSVGSAIRSHSAAIARGLWPWRPATRRA